jgi:magnesium-transporting ATPase (P-type)
MDMAVYGVMMGALCLVAFVIVVFGVGGGNLGSDCNEIYSDSCDVVFRARATVFALLTWTLLLFAWECKHFERSLFRLIPSEPFNPRNVSHNIYSNRFLFWAIVIAFFSVFPVIYIPVLNTTIFKHKPIGWEWAIVIGGLILFLLGVETWKFMKRDLMRRGDNNMSGFGRRLKSVVTDESRISASADPIYLIEKPHLFGRSLV